MKWRGDILVGWQWKRLYENRYLKIPRVRFNEQVHLDELHLNFQIARSILNRCDDDMMIKKAALDLEADLKWIGPNIDYFTQSCLIPAYQTTFQFCIPVIASFNMAFRRLNLSCLVHPYHVLSIRSQETG